MKPIPGHNLLKLEVTMEIKIQSIHFDATEKLQAFIEKKVAKLEKNLRRYTESRGAIEGRKTCHRLE